MYLCCHLCAVRGPARTACWALCAPAKSDYRCASSSEAHSSSQSLHLPGSSPLPPPAALLLYSVDANTGQFERTVKNSMSYKCLHVDADLFKLQWKACRLNKQLINKRKPAHITHLEKACRVISHFLSLQMQL